MRRQPNVTESLSRSRLSLLEKWRKHKILPWKFVLHVLLLCCTTAQLVSYNRRDGGHLRAVERNWYHWFFPRGFDLAKTSTYLYSQQETIDAVSVALSGFESIVESSVDRLNYTSPNLDCGRCGWLVVESYVHDPVSSSGAGSEGGMSTTVYNVNSTNMGPLDVTRSTPTERSKFFHRLVQMSLGFELMSYGVVPHTCGLWRIELVFQFRQRGQIIMDLDSTFEGECNNTMEWKDLWTRLMWMNVVVIVLAVGYAALNIRSLLHSARLLLRVRRMERRSLRLASMGEASPLSRANLLNSPSASGGSQHLKLSCGDKLRLFNLWFVTAMVAAICNIAYASVNLMNNAGHAPLRLSQKLLAGLGCSLLWVNLAAYFSHDHHYYMLILTLQRSIPRVVRFLVGVMPIIFAYAFFGVLFFGDHSQHFGDWVSSMITLFAVLNGDVIRETFEELLPYFPVTSQIYLYTFICLFIYVVLNVFIAIVEEGFFSTRDQIRGGRRSMAHFAATRRIDVPGGTDSDVWERLHGILNRLEEEDECLQNLAAAEQGNGTVVADVGNNEELQTGTENNKKSELREALLDRHSRSMDF